MCAHYLCCFSPAPSPLVPHSTPQGALSCPAGSWPNLRILDLVRLTYVYLPAAWRAHAPRAGQQRLWRVASACVHDAQLRQPHRLQLQWRERRWCASRYSLCTDACPPLVPFPVELRACTRLATLNIMSADMKGTTVPGQLGTLTSLTTIVMENLINHGGGLPTEIGNLRSLDTEARASRGHSPLR